MKLQNHRLAAHATLFAIFLINLISQKAAQGDESKLPVLPEEYAALINQKLPKGWICTYDTQTVVIIHAEPVTLLNTLSLPGGERNEQFYQEYGRKMPYLIVMKFVARFSDQEQQELAARRQQALDADIKKEREKGRGKYTGKDVYSQFFVPEYNNIRFSIDLQTSETWPLKIVSPANAVTESDEILKLLHANLKKYPTPQ